MIKGYTDDDYGTVREWALAAGQCPPPHFILTRGCFHVEDGKECVCAFLFVDKDNPLSVISFVYFNPEARGKAKARGLREVYKALEYIAVREDRCFVVTDTAFGSVERVLDKGGYLTFIDGARHMMKILPVNDTGEEVD